MKIDWIPEGDEGDYDPVKDVKVMMRKVDEFNVSLELGMKQLEENVKEFNKSAGQLSEA
jgi:hypothetical protein